MSHSQNDEEAVILECVGSSTGTVVDIGAHDGKTFSNSFALIDRGWKGLLIEPSPYAFQKLIELHSANPNVTLINAAIGVETRFVKFYECAGDLYSTCIEANARKWESPERKFAEYWVPQVTLSSILAQIGCGCDVLSIDAEGSTVDILFSSPIGSWAPRVVVLEHDGRILEVVGWMKQRGYSLVESGLNGENAIFKRGK